MVLRRKVVGSEEAMTWAISKTIIKRSTK